LVQIHAGEVKLPGNEPLFAMGGAKLTVLIIVAALAVVGGVCLLLRIATLLRRRDDEQLRTLADLKLEATVRRAERERYYAALFDEVRAPLGHLQRSVEELTRLCRNCDQATAVAEAGKETDRLWQLSTRIATLVAAANAAEHRVHSDLTEAARAAMDLVRPTAMARSIAFSLDAPSPVPCRLSIQAIRDAVTELLENAVSASIHGSRIELRVRQLGGAARIEVLDFGPGIPIAQQEAVFDPLARRARGKLGDGLGLAIAREAARAHGGNVWVAPSENAGAKVVLEIPAA
jgi:two-component system OmpR family sensor kinase